MSVCLWLPWGPALTQPRFASCSFSAPKCGRGKPALVRRHTLEDRSELISCIENGNYAKAARIAAGESAPTCPLPASHKGATVRAVTFVWDPWLRVVHDHWTPWGLDVG